MIHIVDDDAAFRTALGRLLRGHGYVIAEYPSAEHFLQQLGAAAGGCLVLDVRLPGLSGPDLQARLAELGSPLPIIFVSGHGDVATTVQTIKAGAEDFLTKPVAGPVLLASIERAVARYESERAQQEWLQGARTLLDRLTPREREVFEHVVRGRMNKQTAHALGITERTIKAHRQRIFAKLDARTLADLVSLAERLQLLPNLPGHEAPRRSS